MFEIFENWLPQGWLMLLSPYLAIIALLLVNRYAPIWKKNNEVFVQTVERTVVRRLEGDWTRENSGIAEGEELTLAQRLSRIVNPFTFLLSYLDTEMFKKIGEAQNNERIWKQVYHRVDEADPNIKTRLLNNLEREDPLLAREFRELLQKYHDRGG